MDFLDKGMEMDIIKSFAHIERYCYCSLWVLFSIEASGDCVINVV